MVMRKIKLVTFTTNIGNLEVIIAKLIKLVIRWAKSFLSISFTNEYTVEGKNGLSLANICYNFKFYIWGGKYGWIIIFALHVVWYQFLILF